MQILRAYRIGVRCTHEEVSEYCVKCVTDLVHRRRGGLRLGPGVAGQHRPVGPHFLRTVGYDVVAPLPVGAHADEAQGCHRPAQLVGGEPLRQRAADVYQDIGGADELSRLALLRHAAVAEDDDIIRYHCCPWS